MITPERARELLENATPAPWVIHPSKYVSLRSAAGHSHRHLELPCEYITCRSAPPPATHIAIWNCHSIMLCTDSVAREREILDKIRSGWFEFFCHICKKPLLPDEIRIEPLP